MKPGKILLVANSNYLYTPRSLFWPDAIFLTGPNLDSGQAVGMAISVQRVVNLDSEVVIKVGSIDHLQSRGLLTALIDGSTPSSEAVGEAIMTLLSAMLEAERSIRRIFVLIFVQSPGYALLPEPLQFVYAMVVLLAEGRFDAMIPAPNRQVDPSCYYPYQSELPTIWSDISNAVQGFKDHSTTRVVLDEGLGLELSNFGRLFKRRPGVGDEHQLLQRLANNLWFRQTDYVRDERGNFARRNALSAEEDLKAMALRTKPHANPWLYLTPRLCVLGQDAFDNAPSVVREIHQNLQRILDVREQARATILQMMQEIKTMSLDRFQADVLAMRPEYERSGATLAGIGVGWSPAFVSSCNPRASRNLIANFVRDIRKLSIGFVLAL